MFTYSELYKRLQIEAIPFVDYMHHALYEPNFGYYSTGQQKFGAEGDFITAPELTPLFGQTLANQCQEILAHLTQPIIFEFGAGSGRLCVDVLTRLEAQGSLPIAYWILEVSPDLRQRQQALIQQSLPHLFERVVWLSRWPKQAFQGVVIANEVLDAMPVHRFLQMKEGIFEVYVGLNTHGELVELIKPCPNHTLLDYVQSNIPSDWHPYLSEVNLFIEGWLRQCFTMLQQGALLLIDYGFPKHEFFHPDRNQGTLMCHYRHRAHSNPYAHPGQEDITAHVNFTQVAEAASSAGFHVAGYTNQAAFLLSNGLLNLLETIDDTKKRIMAQQAVKQLTFPSEMGELFKVMALSKGLDIPLMGFQLHDKRASL